MVYKISLFSFIVSSLNRKSPTIFCAFSIYGLCKAMGLFSYVIIGQSRVKYSRVSIVSSHNKHVVFSPVNLFLSFSGKQFVLALYLIADGDSSQSRHVQHSLLSLLGFVITIHSHENTLFMPLHCLCRLNTWKEMKVNKVKMSLIIVVLIVKNFLALYKIIDDGLL